MKAQIKFFPVIVLFLLPTILSAQTPVPGGLVSGTWDQAGSPYEIQGDLTIAPGQSLTIDPGVTVEFQGHYGIYVAGSLIAEGTLSDTIFFAIYDTTGFHNINIADGGWHGLRFGYSGPGTDSSRISYCVFAFGKAIGTQYIDKIGGAIAAMNYNDLEVKNSIFFMNSAADAGGAIAINNSDAILDANNFFHCKGLNGGAIAATNSDADITNSFFVDNHASNSGGAIGLHSGSDCNITTNLMAGNFANYGGAIQAETNCNPMVRNCLIYSNVAYEEGGGLDIEDNSNGTFINNTIVDNMALFGGGLDVEVNANPVFRNCIFWDNSAFVDGPQIHLFSEDSDPDFYYCDVEWGTDSIGTWYGGSTYSTYEGTYENNYDTLPDFIEEGNYLYLLNDVSPCIDGGDPDEAYNDNEDPDNLGTALWPSKGTLRNDLGAYGGPYPIIIDILTGIKEKFQPKKRQRTLQIDRCYPIPATDRLTIEFSNTTHQQVTVKVTSISGIALSTSAVGFVKPGNHKHNLKLGQLPAGIYIVLLSSGNCCVPQKIAITGK